MSATKNPLYNFERNVFACIRETSAPVVIIELLHCSIYATGKFSVEGRGELGVGLVGCVEERSGVAL